MKAGDKVSYTIIFLIGWLLGLLTGLANGLSERSKKVERYKRALQFYATNDFYEPWREEDENRTDAFNFVDLDGGDRAREALKN